MIERTAMTERTVSVDGFAWRVRIAGRGPALLAVHGAGASGASFDPLRPWLEERFTIVAPDLPGHGGTRSPRAFEPSLAAVARSLGQLLEALDLAPEVAVGHSAGAAVVARMALDRVMVPDRLVGLAPALVPLGGRSRAIYSAAARLLSGAAPSRVIASSAGRSDAVRRMLARVGSRLDGAGVERYRSLVARPDHVAGVLRMMSRWDLESLYRSLPRLDRPFLLVAGEHDGAVPLEHAVAAELRLPRAQLVVVRDAGHLVHEERPGEVARRIAERRGLASLGVRCA